jgi:hypothetical protein
MVKYDKNNGLYIFGDDNSSRDIAIHFISESKLIPKEIKTIEVHL